MTLAADPVLAVAVRAAQRAASVLCDTSRDLKRLPLYSREHRDMVAAADADAEDAIVATIRAAFPDHAVLGAESGHIAGAREGSGFKWIVDPIDGTANFVHGFPYYAISIALARGTEITHAVVLDPVHNECFIAARDQGAELDGTPLCVSTCTALADALVATAIPARETPQLAPYLPIFHAVLSQCGGVRRAGACSLDLANLAAGRLDGFWVTSVSGWDVAAGALIVREAGGRVGNFAGASDFLRSDEVIAAAPGVFNGLREAIVVSRQPKAPA